ncbi:MAG: lmo0937 family membrane protein [Vulcanimicrobiota bacterium]
MSNTVLGILLALWLLGMISGLLGWYVHILLVVSLVGVALRLVEASRPDEPPEEHRSTEPNPTYHLFSRKPK